MISNKEKDLDSFFRKYCHPDDETLTELDMAIKSANHTMKQQMRTKIPIKEIGLLEKERFNIKS